MHAPKPVRRTPGPPFATMSLPAVNMPLPFRLESICMRVYMSDYQQAQGCFLLPRLTLTTSIYSYSSSAWSLC